tara:strand:+ start:18908 stop:19114 length:207 start_codon:yes stop_codon:yes gene_type:complete
MQEITIDMIKLLGNQVFYGIFNDTKIVETFKLENGEFYFWDTTDEIWDTMGENYFARISKIFILTEDI